MSRVRRLSILNWANHLLLGAGLFGPCMTVTPHMGSLDDLARWLGLVDEPKTYSVATGILQLLSGGNVAIGIVLLVFSALFPVAKLVILRAALACHTGMATFAEAGVSDRSDGDRLSAAEPKR